MTDQHGARWTGEADAELRRRVTAKQTIAQIAREEGRKLLPAAAVLGANPRTILLGLSMIAGTPLWFFLIEIVVLNVVLVLAIVQAAYVGRQMTALIAHGHR